MEIYRHNVINLIKEQVDIYLGMKTEIIPRDESRVLLVIKSPNGIKLSELSYFFSRDREEWCFGGFAYCISGENEALHKICDDVNKSVNIQNNYGT